jgi:hypothetical protein
VFDILSLEVFVSQELSFLIHEYISYPLTTITEFCFVAAILAAGQGNALRSVLQQYKSVVAVSIHSRM